MKSISQEVDSWIAESELPTRPGLKAVSRFDDLHNEEYLSVPEMEQEILVCEREAMYHAEYDFFITYGDVRRYAVLPFNKYGRPDMFVSDSSKDEFIKNEGLSETEFQERTIRIL